MFFRVVVILLTAIAGISNCEAQTTVILQPGSNDGKDALLHGLSSEVNVNYGANNQLSANTWTYNGSVGTVRSVLKFDLTSIPSGATITSAELFLFGIGDNSGFGGHSTLSGSNEALIERVTSVWDENLVTWNTQPSTTTLNQVLLAPSISSDDDYLNINVTDLVQGMIDFGNNGFMIKLQIEDHYRRLNFASSDHQDTSLHPTLLVCYQDTLAEISNLKESRFGVIVYPNPVDDFIKLKLLELTDVHNGIYNIRIHDTQGKTLLIRSTNSPVTEVNVSSLNGGIYFVTVEAENGSEITKRIIKNN